jgi:hypothetical protein
MYSRPSRAIARRESRLPGARGTWEGDLARCFTYVDLNMVRAGVVGHPRQWREAGYQEIQNPPKRYRVIDRRALCELVSIQF